MRIVPFSHKRVFILNFHGLGEPPSTSGRGDERYWTDPNLFKTMVENLRGRSDVAVTFDDSFESDYSIALPILNASKMTARFFVVANRVDQKGFLSKDQIQTLLEEGMTIGSHGMDHRKWSSLGHQELHREVVEARDRLEQIAGVPIVEAACPFGAYNRRVLHRLKESGFVRVYTSDGGSADPGAWIQPRNTFVRGDSLKSVLETVEKIPSVPKEAWRQLKFGLKRWR